MLRFNPDPDNKNQRESEAQIRAAREQRENKTMPQIKPGAQRQNAIVKKTRSPSP